MKQRRFLRQILSVVLALFMVAGSVCGVDFLPELEADAASTYDTITDLYHDAAEPFLSNIQPQAGDKVTIRLRAVKGNLSSARLYYYNLDSGYSSYVSMTKSSTVYDNSGYYEYWEASYTVPNSSGVRYWFYARNNSGIRYLYQYRDGAYNNVSTSSTYKSGSTYYGWLLAPKVQTPEWSHGSTWYSFVPDEFFNGDPSNDDYDSDGNLDISWNNKIDENLNNRYGGDFQGVMDKIAYIKSLGVNGICFNPVNSANQSVGYGSSNFNQIESTLGNAQTYKQFIDFMHNNGLRLIQDVAVYHTSNDSIIVNNSNRWPTPGASAGVDSPYYSVIVDHTLSNNTITTPRWGGSIINHADSTTQALLWSTEEGALVRYANDALGFGVDGYRLDCGGWMIGHDTSGNKIETIAIMQEIRGAIKAVNPEAVVLSEASGATQLNSGAWDGEWNLNFLNYTTEIYKGNQNINYLRGLVMDQLLAYSRQSLLPSHLQLNTHDNQGKHFNNDNKSVITALKLAQMTGVGSPSVYFGEETNYTNGTNYGFTYFNWDESTWNYDVMNFTKALIELRNEYSAVRDGAFYEYTNDTAHWYYGRFNQDGAVLTVTNTSNTATSTTVSAYKLGLGAGDTFTDWFTGKTYTVNSSGNVTVPVPAGGTIYVSGGNRSNFFNGHYASDISNSVGDEIELSVAGNDVTNDYYTNNYVSVGADSSAVVTNVKLGNKFAVSGDYTFTAAASSNQQANQLGLSIGETTVDGVTYKVGVVLRPYIISGVQAILCLTSGVADSQSKWIGVFAGPAVTMGASNTVNFKLEYDNGILKAYFNGVYKSQIDVSAYDIDFAPEFFTRGSVDPLTFSVANVQVTGEVVTSNNAIVDSDGTVTVSRVNDTITLAEDNFKFFNTAAFGAYSYSAYVNAYNSTGSPLVMLRESLDGDSPYYAAVNNGGRVTVYARYKYGATPVAVATVSASTACYIKLERDADNTFRAYIGSGTDSSVNYVLISGSETSIAMDERNYVGFSNLNGSASVRPLGSVNAGNKIYADDFSGTVLKPLLNGIQNSSATLSGGKLTLAPGDILTANTPDNDWTFKTKFGFTSTTENDFAGLVNYQDADTYLFAGRKVIDGKIKLVFGKNSGGNLMNFVIVDDPNPTAEITVQLQRISSMYTVVYTYDEAKWYSLGEKIFYNMSDENPGLMVTGTTNCAFDFVSFGNAVNDGATFNTPHTPDLNGFEVTQDKFTGTYNLFPINGTWQDVSEGFLQSQSGTAGVLAVTSAKYEDFRVNVTLKLEGASWAGVNFGRKYPKQTSGGYLVKYTTAGKVVLEKDGTELASYTLTDEAVDGGFLKLVVECINGNLYISVGQNAKPVIEILDSEYVSGYIALCCDGIARFTNQNINHISANMHKPDTTVQYSDAGVQINKGTTYYTVNITEGGISANYTVSQYIAKYAKDSDKDGTISDEEKEVARAEFYQKLKEANESFASKRIFASMRGTASTDFIISTNISIIRKVTEKVVDTDENGTETKEMIPNYYADMPQQIGLLLGTAAGKTDLENDGVYVKYTSEGKLYLERNGENLVAPYTVEGSPLNIELMVIKKNGTYYIYVNGSKSPVLTYTESVSNGGAFTFLGNNVVAVFDGIAIHDLDPDEDYATTPAYIDWMSDANLANKGGYFFDDFSSSSVNDDEWLVHHGDFWAIENGILHTLEEEIKAANNGKGAWDSSVCYTGGSYSDFILNFKIMSKNPSGWGSIGWRRISPGVNHQSNGTYLLFNANGNITHMGYNLNAEDSAYESSKTSVGNVNYNNQWQSFTLVVQGTTIRLYKEGKLVYHGQDTQYREGYIELKGANGYWAFDDVEIIPLSTKTAPVVDDTDIADELKVSVNYTDYTSTYQANKTIVAGANQPVTFSNFNAFNDKFNLSAKLERTTQNEGYFETKIGVAEYAGEHYDLTVRINPFVSATGIYSVATLCLVSSESIITLDTWYVDGFGTNKSSYDLDVAYESNKLSVWLDNQTAFVGEMDLAEYGVELVLPELAFASSACGIKISNLAVFGGATAQELVSTTITDGFTFNGENGENYTYDYMLDGSFALDSSKAFIENAEVVFLTEISANVKLDSSNYDKLDYNFGFILGTGKKNGVTSPIYAVLSQKSKTAEIYFGTTKVYTANVKVEPQFGENIFWDDDEEHLTENDSFTSKNEFNLAVTLTRGNVVSFSVDGITAYTVNLAALGISKFMPTPGFVSDGIEVALSDIELSGIGTEKVFDIENVTENIVIDNAEYTENGSYTVTGSSVNTLNNILLRNQKFYFVGATFSSLDASDMASIQLGLWGNRSVEIAVKSDLGDAYAVVILGANNGVGSAGYMEEQFEITTADTYELCVGYTDSGITAWVNGQKVISDYYSAVDTFEFAVKTESQTAVAVSDIAAWGTMAAKVIINETTNGSVNIVSSDNQNGMTVITVNPDQGYQIVAGSLKYTDENGVVRNVIGRYNDDNANEFVIYDSDSSVKVTAEFTDMSVTSITTATIGSNLHTFDDTVSGIERIDGVRFLTRLYMPISDFNPQADTITVKYNGNTYTVEDYGALMVPTTIMDGQGIAYRDLSFDNMNQLTAKCVSAKSGAIYYNSQDYLDFTVVVKVPKTNKTGADRDTYYNKYYAREYVLRSYVVLRPEGATDSSPDITIYGESFTDSINNVVERMESEGK